MTPEQAISLSEETRLRSLCAECGESFDPDEWENRHSDENGEDVHEDCCLICGAPEREPEPQVDQEQQEWEALAQRSKDRARPVVVVTVRHPDYANETSIFTPNGMEKVVIDLDLGASFDISSGSGDPETVATWCNGTLHEAAKVAEWYPEAGLAIAGIVNQVMERFDLTPEDVAAVE